MGMRILDALSGSVYLVIRISSAVWKLSRFYEMGLGLGYVRLKFSMVLCSILSTPHSPR